MTSLIRHFDLTGLTEKTRSKRNVIIFARPGALLSKMVHPLTVVSMKFLMAKYFSHVSLKKLVINDQSE